MSISIDTYVSTANSFHQKTSHQPPLVAVELGCRLLESWTKNFTALSDAYRSKEDFFAIYDAMTTPEAKAAYATWEKKFTCHKRSIQASCDRHWELRNRDNELLRSSCNNAYTDSLNSLIRVGERNGCKYFFEALRAKVLYSAGAYKKYNISKVSEKTTV